VQLYQTLPLAIDYVQRVWGKPTWSATGINRPRRSLSPSSLSPTWQPCCTFIRCAQWPQNPGRPSFPLALRHCTARIL